MHDLIVVGAGPAGASAARAAAQQGLKTLLVEKDQIPRNKLCGGGVTPKVLKLLDFSLPDGLVECAPKSTRVHVGNSCHPFETDQPLVYMTSRTKFDAYLTDKAVEAGAELMDRSAVHTINQTASTIEVKTPGKSFHSKMLIGADGMGGTTARGAQLYGRWNPDQVAYAIESEVPVGEKGVVDFIGSEAFFDVYFGVSAGGYGWVFPKDDHLTVGVGCRLSKLRNARELFNDFVKRIPQLNGVNVPNPQAHLIPLGGYARVPTVTDRVMLAGDSAGFAEPLLGEGIYLSILGAQIAAQVAVQACRTNRYDKRFLNEYPRRCRKAFGRDLDIAYDVACFTYLEQYDMERVARFFFSEKKVQESMVGLLDGSLRYRDVRTKIAWPYLKYRLAKLGLPFYS
jgi:geranylgeranyl reductase family protein